jgi:hypothetical protein
MPFAAGFALQSSFASFGCVRVIEAAETQLSFLHKASSIFQVFLHEFIAIVEMVFTFTQVTHSIVSISSIPCIVIDCGKRNGKTFCFGYAVQLRASL